VGAKELGPVTVTEGVYCAASDDDCSPPCSPGFTCDEGACEPECNPQCSANQVCRVDRTCGPPATGDGAK
jgi:hypothetical protein